MFKVLSRTVRTVRDGLVVGIIVIRFWVFDDYIPCVEETGDVAEAAKGQVDDRVGRADSYLDPDCSNQRLYSVHLNADGMQAIFIAMRTGRWSELT